MYREKATYREVNTMKIFEHSPLVDIPILAVLIYLLYLLVSKAIKADRFHELFRNYIKQKHTEFKIVKEQGPLCFIIFDNNKYILNARKCYRRYKKNPDKFSDIVEAYLFELLYVEKIKIENNSSTKEIPKLFS